MAKMNELKVILATPHPKMKNACDGAIEVYPKSEADKVIAEHMIEKEPKNLMWHKRHKHYGRWMMLWRCFAEEFKEAKETLELVKKANALCKEAK